MSRRRPRTSQPPPSPGKPTLEKKPAARLWWAFGFVAVAIVVGAWLYWSQYARIGLTQDRKGLAALAAQQPTEAEQEWLQGTREDPASPDCYVHLGDLYMQQKRYPEAATEYTRASRLLKNDGVLFVKLTQAELAVGDQRAAEAAARRASVLRPDDPDAVGLYGLIESSDMHWAEAVAALRRAHALRPTDRDYLLELVHVEANNIDLPQAERDLTPYLTAHPDDGWACHLMAFIIEQKPYTPQTYQMALAYELRARAGMPNDIRVNIALGTLYLNMGRPADALRTYQEGLQSHRNSEEMLHGLVTCYTKLGQTQKAADIAAELQTASDRHQRITRLKEIFQDNPADVVSGLELARLDEQDGDDRAAHGLYVELARSVPQDPRPRRALADFFLRHNRPGLAHEVTQSSALP